MSNSVCFNIWSSDCRVRNSTRYSLTSYVDQELGLQTSMVDDRWTTGITLYREPTEWGGESDWQNADMYSLTTLSICVAWPHAQCTYSILHALQLANSPVAEFTVLLYRRLARDSGKENRCVSCRPFSLTTCYDMRLWIITSVFLVGHYILVIVFI